MRKALAVSLVFCLTYAPLQLPAYAAAPGPSPDDAAVPQDYSDQTFSPEQLDNLLAPIALYPDPLLAQVLLAATFVDQVDEAARWVRANGPNGVDDQYWDVSVKAVAHYPSVLYMMADKLDWTTTVGQAYVNQSTDVMTAVQRLRAMAHAQGNLVTTPEQQVIVEREYIYIVPAQPRYIFVPRYDPAVIYFRRSYFGGIFVGGAFAFGTGFLIGAWLNHDCDWREHRVFYTGWRGGGWIERSRPVINVTNVYVNNRYTNVTINRTVVNRTVNYTNINRYNSVHRDVTYRNVGRNTGGNQANTRVNNNVINRNINTNDPRINQHRGWEGHGRPAPRQPGGPPPQPQSRPTTPPAARPQPPPGPHVYGRSEGNFDPHASSQRGQNSRSEASRPSQPKSEPKNDRHGSDKGGSEKHGSDKRQ